MSTYSINYYNKIPSIAVLKTIKYRTAFRKQYNTQNSQLIFNEQTNRTHLNDGNIVSTQVHYHNTFQQFTIMKQQ